MKDMYLGIFYYNLCKGENKEIDIRYFICSIGGYKIVDW